MQKWCLGCNFIVANTQLSLFIWKFLLHVCYAKVFCEITTLIFSELRSEIIPQSRAWLHRNARSDTLSATSPNYFPISAVARTPIVSVQISSAFPTVSVDNRWCSTNRYGRQSMLSALLSCRCSLRLLQSVR